MIFKVPEEVRILGKVLRGLRADQKISTPGNSRRNDSTCLSNRIIGY